MRFSLTKLTGLVLVVSSLFMYPPTTSAHCPDPGFDDTVFAPIQPGGARITLEMVASGLTAPVKGVVAPGEPDRLYVVDQAGKLWAVDLTDGEKVLFLDVSARLVPLGFLGPNTFDERGFLGVAFHPDYAINGKLYTYTSEPNSGMPTFPTTMPPGTPPDHQNVVAEWTAVAPGNPALGVDPTSRRELIREDHPQFNHNGGDLAFGPDGMFYIAIGDGGEADDQGVGHVPGGNAQQLTNALGKIHRIDVNGSNSANGQYGIPADNPFVGVPGAVTEIFAFGFRNPFRFSIDMASGALYVGDVGQNDIEEVDLIVKGGNYGWNRKEGTLFFYENGDDDGFASTVDNGLVPPGVIDPIAQYDTHHEGHSVIAGFVYHGSRIPQLQGRFVFGDFSRIFNFPGGPNNFGRLLYLAQQHTAQDRLLNIQEFAGLREALDSLGLIVPTTDCFPNTLAVLGMGQDASGELYVMGNVSGTPFGAGGVVLRIAPVSGR
jgi:glucose/arabinose dehydrogenase